MYEGTGISIEAYKNFSTQASEERTEHTQRCDVGGEVQLFGFDLRTRGTGQTTVFKPEPNGVV